MSKVIVFVSYESPLFPAGGIAAVMAKLPSAVEAVSGLPTIVITPFHYNSQKIAAFAKESVGDSSIAFDDDPKPVTVFHYGIGNSWYFLRSLDDTRCAKDRFFGGERHPYDVPKETLLRDSLFFGAAAVDALRVIADHLGLNSEAVEWNLMTQDWEGATAALAFASQDRYRGRLHLTLHNSYDDYASSSDFARAKIDPERCPGDTILDRALNLVEQPVFTVSDQFAKDLKYDLLQNQIMAKHLQPVLARCSVVGVDNGPFKQLSIDENLLRGSTDGDFSAIDAWKVANRTKALGALATHNESDREPIWGNKSLFRRDNATWFVMAGRDDPRQKGYDVACAAIEDYLVARHGKSNCAQFLFFPIPGDEGIAGLRFLDDLARRFPEDVIVFPFIWAAGFSAALQGAAYGLMPSIYEPFGMANEFYLDGGCVGIGRATGGNLEQIIPLRGAASHSQAVAVRVKTYHSLSAHPTGILFREPDNMESAFIDWATINAADYKKTGMSRVEQRKKLHVFRAIADELEVAIEDGIRIYHEQKGLYYRMLAEGVHHIQRTFSWRRAGQEYARKVRSFGVDGRLSVLDDSNRISGTKSAQRASS